MTRLVLVGAGHAHAQVLLDWARSPVAGVEMTLVSPHPLAPYSGMVPGWLAGTYAYDEICIDFARLAAAAGARLLHDELAALDPDRRTVTLASGARLAYDLLSLNIGSTLTPPRDLDAPVLALRPLAELRDAWQTLLQGWQAAGSLAPCTITTVGAGAAGFESTLAVLVRLRALQPQRRFSGRLVARSPRLLEGHTSAAAVRAAERALTRAGVTLELGVDFTPAHAAGSDLVLWATGAEAHAWQRDATRRGSLAVDERGFIRIDKHLRSLSHPQIHAAGDCCAWREPLPKAGVFAVRMAPVLAHNLRAALGAGPVGSYRPQRRFLALLSTADGRAIATRGGWAFEGRWAWRWKDHIDRAFVRRYR